VFGPSAYKRLRDPKVKKETKKNGCAIVAKPE
jgi:hypothetical protein